MSHPISTIDLDKSLPSMSGKMPWTLRHAIEDPNFAREYQQVVYPDVGRVEYHMNKLAQAKPLTSYGEVTELKHSLATVVNGNAHIVQAGLCVEPMKLGTNASHAKGVYSLVCDLAKGMSERSGKYVVPIARGAGQVFKPRSAYDEEVNGKRVLTYRGPAVHGFSPDERTPNPARLIQTYENAQEVLAEMEQKRRDIHLWPHNYKVHASHEGLSLPYEMALLRKTPQGDYFASSAPFLWVGNRTRPDANAPHVQFAAYVDNPVGLKCSDDMDPELLEELITTINPYGEKGKLALIFRFTPDCPQKTKDNLYSAARHHKASTINMCDPGHGCTETDESSGKKTRLMKKMKALTREFVSDCRKHDIHPGGLHIEGTKDPVTECLGGNVTDLTVNYQSLCDPCANGEQSEEIAHNFTDALQEAPIHKRHYMMA